ncbi:hypothetical protein [Pollutibacter soli]|uniref:hypothetical protein n=1 Tax=Pollutibacter soli TaxID=3034157 RepID=UPI00301379E5
MSKTFNLVVSEIRNYFFVMTLFFRFDKNALCDLIFSKEKNTHTIKPTHHPYRFLAITLFIFYFIVKTLPQVDFNEQEVLIQKESRKYYAISDFELEILIFTITCTSLFFVHFLSQFFSKNQSQRKLFSNFSFFTFTSQISTTFLILGWSWICFLIGALDDHTNFIQDSLSFGGMFLIFTYTLLIIFFLPVSIIRRAIFNNDIDRKTGVRLILFAFIPFIITIISLIIVNKIDHAKIESNNHIYIGELTSHVLEKI